MPDHLHLLVTSAQKGGSLDAFMRRAKQTSGYRFKQTTRKTLWQAGYYERVLRADEEPLMAIAYMVANPIRAGFAERAEEWPHWGSACYTRDAVLEAIAVWRG